MPQQIRQIDSSPHREPTQTIEKEEIQLQLKRILDSSEFHATHGQRAFLRFVVAEKLAGRADEIKGYTVATQVFGRKTDFDPNLDPIVSIQANKLRRALERYYLVAGQRDPIQIDIPKGSYVPFFRQLAATEPDDGIRSTKVIGSTSDGCWPILVVRPFQNLTNDAELDYMAIGLATELAMEVTRHQEIRVLMVGRGSSEEQVSNMEARFALDGSIRKDDSGIKVTVQLIDLANHLQIWCDHKHFKLDAGRMIQFQEAVARIATAKICSECGIIARAVGRESKDTPTTQLKTYQAILRYHDFSANFTQNTFERALEALQLAIDIEPQRGLAWAMLARLYGNNYSLELFDRFMPLEDAVAFAKKGARLEPESQLVRLILAYILMLENNLEEGIAEVDRAILLNPHALLHMENCGYLLTLLGDWQRGTALIHQAIGQNPFYNVIVHHALWVDWVRRREYQKAYMETLNFRTPTLFWEPLMKAASFGLMGRIDEGRQAAKDLLKLKPDFSSRGLALIRHYIKFDEIVDLIVKGLQNVEIGLNMKGRIFRQPKGP